MKKTFIIAVSLLYISSFAQKQDTLQLKTIESVTINGKKKLLLERKADRLIFNVEASVATDFWTPTNTTASNPAPFNYVPVASTYYLESADFFRINNITVGYKLPLNENGFINYCRIYVNAVNPFITQKFSGFSPELNGNGDPYGTQGIELDAYPTLRSFVIGANLKF